jgi:excisionase family DNA binding protein
MIEIGAVASARRTFLGSCPPFLFSLNSPIIPSASKAYRFMAGAFSPRSASVWQSLVVSNVLSNVSEWLTVPDVAERLGVPLGRVRRLIEDHHLISVKREGVQHIPAEIIVGNEPLASLHGTIVVLLDAGFTLEGSVEWLYTPNEILGTTPMAALVAGKKAEIRRLAQALAL